MHCVCNQNLQLNANGGMFVQRVGSITSLCSGNEGRPDMRERWTSSLRREQPPTLSVSVFLIKITDANTMSDI